MQGAVGGAAGGFTAGFLYGSYQTGSVVQGLKTGVKGAAIGFIAGGLVGGVVNGLKTAYPGKGNDPRNFWTGEDIASGRGRFSFNNSDKYFVTAERPVMALNQPADDGWDFNLLKKTLYRGTTGSENGDGPLFLTDDPDYAAGYINNGGQVVKVEIPLQGFLRVIQQRTH